MLNQFSRTEELIGKDNVEKLKKAKVAIFGIGGVGSYVVEGFVRAGVGTFILVDKDVVDMFISNFDDIDEFIRLGEIKEGKQKYYIDTIGINKRELCNLGILEENIYLSNVCTKCSSDAYYSYRVHGQDSGRNVTLISMK